MAEKKSLWELVTRSMRNTHYGATPIYISSDIDEIELPKERKYGEDKEWVWVDAYKGTNADMTCRDMQYALGTQYEYDGDVALCDSGYHCCLHLKDVLNYYKIGDNHRFFRVRALVRDADLLKYGMPHPYHYGKEDKLVAKKIEFVSEITSEELFEMCPQPYKVRGEKYYDTAREFGVDVAYKEYLMDKMIEVGYPEEVAEWLTPKCNETQLELAIKIADAPHMSLDTKYAIIFNRG